ncbi:MAG TPA: hypothetical protein VGC14_20425 [Rhizobium sp.]
MKKDQLDLFTWAAGRPTAEIIDLTPIIVRNMPDIDPKYPVPAKVIRPDFERKRSVA